MRALIVFPEEFEDIEAVVVSDILDRAGFEVTKAALGSKVVTSAHGLKIMADCLLSQIKVSDFDVLVLPGGPGHKNLLNSALVIKTIKDFDSKQKTIAAICAAPVVLAAAGVIEDKMAVVHPGYEKNIPRVRNSRVLVSKNIITSQAPGTAMEFALMIVEKTAGKKAADRLKENMLIR